MTATRVNPNYTVVAVALKRPFRKLARFYSWPLCPECAAHVTGTKPLIRQGDEIRQGIAIDKLPDEYIGHELLPCKHRVQSLTVTVGDLTEVRP